MGELGSLSKPTVCGLAHIWSNRPGIHSNCMISEDFSASIYVFYLKVKDFGRHFKPG